MAPQKSVEPFLARAKSAVPCSNPFQLFCSVTAGSSVVQQTTLSLTSGEWNSFVFEESPFQSSTHSVKAERLIQAFS